MPICSLPVRTDGDFWPLPLTVSVELEVSQGAISAFVPFVDDLLNFEAGGTKAPFDFVCPGLRGDCFGP